MELDRLRAEEQSGADLFVREPLSCGSRDLKLLRRELLVRRRAAPAQALTACPELRPGALGPHARADALEHLERIVQMLAALPAPAASAEPLSEAEHRSRPLQLVGLVGM